MLIRPAKDFPLDNLRQLANPPHVAFTHLDWVPPEDRLHHQNTFALEDENTLKALINVAPENNSFAWLRFFYSVQNAKHQQYFQALLSKGKDWLVKNNIHDLYCLTQHSWFENLLMQNGFELNNRIITLTTSDPIHHRTTPNPIFPSPIAPEDYFKIAELDAQCFQAPWQLNYPSMIYCAKTSAYATGIYIEGEPVAYQISHVLFDFVHLGRLAVHPGHRGKGYAQLLFSDLIDHFSMLGEYIFSVNTQQDNHGSILLYNSLGFKNQDQSMPVYKLSMPE